MPTHQKLLQEFERLMHSTADAEAFMQRMTDRLHGAVPRYNWVGFYLTAKDDSGALVVGPYTGSFAPHIHIPAGKGICGAAASTGKTLIVDDVARDLRYMQGSELVKSEMVVPIFAAKKLIGVLDVESYSRGTFTDQAQQFVEACASLVARHFQNRHKSGRTRRGKAR